MDDIYTRAATIADQIAFLLAGECDDIQRLALARAIAAWRDQAPLASVLFVSPAEMDTTVEHRDTKTSRLMHEVARASERLERERQSKAAN